MDIALDKAVFIELWVGTLLYGVNTVIFIGCLYVLIHGAHHQRRTQVNKYLVVTVTVTYLLCAVHIINDFARAITGFFDASNGVIAYYDQLWIWSSILRQATWTSACIVADTVLIYRLFVVWNSNIKVTVVPSIVLTAASVCAFISVWGFSQIHPGEDVFNNGISKWAKAGFALHLTTNAVLTSLIAGRLWWFGHQISAAIGHKHGKKYGRSLAIIVESGAIYSVSLVIFLVVYALDLNSSYIAYGALTQIVGIAPTLIIVRVGLGRSAHDTTTYRTSMFKREMGRLEQCIQFPYPTSTIQFRHTTSDMAPSSPERSVEPECPPLALLEPGPRMSRDGAV